MNINGETTAFPGVVSNVFPAVARAIFSETEFYWFKCDHVMLLSVIRTEKLFL